MAVDGKFIIVDVGGIQILGQTGASWDGSVEMLETTDKLSKDPTTGVTHKTYIGGDRDGTIGIDGNYDFADDNWKALYDLYSGATVQATIVYGGEEVGDKVYSQEGLLSNISRSDAQNSIATYSATFQKSGPVTETVVIA